MQIQKMWYAPVCLFLIFAVACKQGPSASEVPAVGADKPQSFAAPSPAPAKSVAATIASAAADTGPCGGALDAIGSCALAKVCDEDIGMYLPAASRDALIAMEKSSGYSAAAFDRYCLSACQARSGELDEAAFTREVCGAPMVSAAVAGSKPGVVDSFSLHGQLEVGSNGVALDQITQRFGAPTSKRDSRYECGSAFDEGAIQEYLYPDFVLETDGKKAVVRSLQLSGGNRLKLADGQSFDALNETQFKSIFGATVQRFNEAFRVSAEPDGSLESAFDFHFKAGKLKQVDYWIGC